ncbi:MAG: 50S ribosomal protein L9 [Gemmatales bacterium]|nr:50S ribosomal protein L9 [Gemmatales bacterium]MCS7161010.1 50S ribosomal protein L9 [Gemmatales bacterium]MDW8176213.1 50S ribosomal protein L9 [Gemmatales bacterium]MDW8221670.1 50S ribosomal protein L9 [Gemmatales bacterium]
MAKTAKDTAKEKGKKPKKTEKTAASPAPAAGEAGVSTVAEKSAPPKKPIKKRQQIPRGPNRGMQLLLIDDVPHLGRAGDVVEVRPGYGRNYLLPRGLATYVTPENLRRLEQHKHRIEQLRQARLADLKNLAARLRDVTITIEATANEEGKLYGSVGPQEISHALKAQGYNIEPEQVRMEGPIKQLALYAVKLHLGYDIESEVKVLVIGAEHAALATAATGSQ